MAYELGVLRKQSYKWKEQPARHGEEAFSGHGRPANGKDAAVARPQRELVHVTESRKILEKRRATDFAKGSCPAPLHREASGTLPDPLDVAGAVRSKTYSGSDGVGGSTPAGIAEQGTLLRQRRQARQAAPECRGRTRVCCW